MNTQCENTPDAADVSDWIISGNTGLFKITGSRYVGGAANYWEPIVAEPGEQLSHSDIEERSPDAINKEEGQFLLLIAATGFGDYTGSLVQKSNRLKLLEIFGDEFFYDIYSVYCYTCLAVPLEIMFADTEKSEELRETIGALTDYPLIDDEHHSTIEIEAQDEAWESSYRDDFVSAIERNLDISIEQNNDAIDTVFHCAKEATNEYWSNQQGDECYINIDRIAESVTEEDLEDNQISFESD